MGKIFITRHIPEEGIDLLKDAGHVVDISEKEGVLTKEELIHALSQKPYDAVLCLLTDSIDGEVMDAVPTAKLFANYAVGYDNIDIQAAKERVVLITNTPDVLTTAVAEHTFALIMALAKRIPEADRFVRAEKYDGWAPMLLLGTELQGKTLGLIGTGRIGQRVGEIALAFGMSVTCFDISKNEKLEQMGATLCSSVDEILERSDFVSLHVPLLDSTHHLINKENLAKMKSESFLINTSRGPVVDEEVLTIFLKEKRIRGAALDVFEHEPQLTPGLSDLENVILTPHIASGTEEARNAMSRVAAENIIAYLKGEEPPNALVS